MESYILVLVIVVLANIILDRKLLISLKRYDNQTYVLLGQPGYLATLRKYKYWYSFLLLSGYRKHMLSSKSFWLCVANQIVMFLSLILLLGWFTLV